MALVALLVPIVLLLIGEGLLILAFIVWIRWPQNQQRRSPLTRDLLSPPAWSTLKARQEIDDEILVTALLIGLTPVLVYASHVSMSYLAGVGESTLRLILTALTGVLVAGGLAIHLWRLLRRRLNYQQGLEGELATAEELNQLMLSGCRVFHDIPFPYGNIDHVVISPSGAFLVETKCIGRPRGRESEADVVVDHERNEIRFPHRTVAIPHQQLDRSVRWLSQKLYESTGTPTRIEPMLALPGWFIRQRVGKGGVCVFNPRAPHRFFIHNWTVHSAERIQQLAHQLEILCRSVEPSRKSRKESISS